MQRSRRLASMAVVASLAVAGLTACRSEPATAAYVGDTRITEKQVQKIWDEARQSVGDAGTVPVSRAQIVRALVTLPVMEQVAANNQVALPADLPYDQIAESVKLPATIEYVRLLTKTVALQILVNQKVTAVATLSEDDLRAVYKRAEDLHALRPGATFDAFRSGMDEELSAGLKSGVGRRNEIDAVTEKLHVTVNPRYQPMEIVTYAYPVSQTGSLNLVAAALGDQTPLPVTDVS
ncbi:hypothetical protein [Actinoplanes sp. HUAS TT8]|uniref:hypothetical protein n=1 Tax=Actinoplanes sp. HUAS TT8 TaxID=3447453 RepID=UPI003F51F2E9